MKNKKGKVINITEKDVIVKCLETGHEFYIKKWLASFGAELGDSGILVFRKIGETKNWSFVKSS